MKLQPLVGLLAMCLCAGAAAQDATASYPSRSIKLVVPFPAGSATDSAARVVMNRLSQVIKQPVVIDNRGGASGTIGADAVRTAAPDGYTLLLGTASTQALRVAFSAGKPPAGADVEAVGLIGTSPYVIVSGAQTGIKTLNDVITRSKAKPGSISYASAGNSSMANLTAHLLTGSAGIQMNHIPYKTSAQAVTDVANGSVELQFGTVAPVMPLLRSGALTAVAVTGRDRLSLLPQVPTVAELGFTGFEAGLWMGVFAPPKTPQAIIDRVASALRTTLAEPEVIAALQLQGIEVTPIASAELKRFVDAEVVKWTRVVRDARIPAE